MRKTEVAPPTKASVHLNTYGWLPYTSSCASPAKAFEHGIDAFRITYGGREPAGRRGQKVNSSVR